MPVYSRRSIPLLPLALPSDLPERVSVYRNLNQRGERGEPVYSVVEAKSGGLVLAHVFSIALVDAELRVSQAGRQRVLRERRKNVHARVTGRPVLPQASRRACFPVTYNPYLFDTFVVAETGESIHCAAGAILDANGLRCWLETVN